MPRDFLDTRLRRLLGEALTPPSADEAGRLWERVLKLCGMNLVSEPIDRAALELACAALFLPAGEPPDPDAPDPTPRLRDRAERSTFALVNVVGGTADDSLLDRTIRVLREIPERPPVLDEARLLGDAISLGDFGVIGLLAMARDADALGQVVERWTTREAYGYWRARLNNSFHFREVRAVARRRYQHGRRAIEMLREELAEDRPPGDAPPAGR